MKTISSTLLIMYSSYISLSLPISLIIIPIIFSFAHSSPITMGSRRRSTYFNKIYAFGDSFTDTGNTNTFSGPAGYQFVSNYPYGKTFFHYPTNRYCDGRLVIDFVAQALSLPYLPPYLHINSIKPHGVNFAVAGATAIEHSFFVRNNVTLAITPQSLQTQLGWFQKLVNRQGCMNLSRTKQRCNNVFDEALIWVGEIGVNDYAYTLASFVSTETIRHLSIKSLTVFLKTLLNKGAKYVVVQGMPPTGCLTLPMQISSEFDRDALGCVGSVNAMSYLHNNILKARLKELRKMFPNATIVYADYWHAYRYIMKNADKYHFFQRFRACCGSGADPYNLNMLGLCGSIISSSCANPSQYINWDGVHLTEAMYKAISQLFLRGTSTRPSFDYLLKQKMKSTS